MIVLSKEPEMIIRQSGEISTEEMEPMQPRNVFSSNPVSEFQSFTELSDEPDTIYFPFEE